MTVRKMLAVGACAVVVALVAQSSSALVLPPVTNVSDTPRYAEGEETVAVNPADSSNIIVGSNQWQPLTSSNIENIGLGPSGFTDCAVWSSHDGGATWAGGRMSESGLGTIDIPDLPDQPILREAPHEFANPGNLISADQNVVFDLAGHAWYQCINFGVFTGDVVVEVYRSDDGGATWGDPVAAFSERDTKIQIDRPFLAVDNHIADHPVLYLTWETMFYQAWLPEVYMRYSDDLGKTWKPQTPIRVDDGVQQTMWDPRQVPAVGADGTLYVAYDRALLASPCQCDPSPIAIDVAQTGDLGATFSRTTAATDVIRANSPDEAYDYFEEMISSIAASPTDPNVLALAWPDRRSGEARILGAVSVDHGSSWSEPVDLTDDPSGAGIAHDHVALAFFPNGRLAVVWRDRRGGSGAFGQPWHVFARTFVVDPDGFLVGGKTIEVTDAAQPPTTGHHGNMPSEYLGVAASADALAVSWDQMPAGGALPDNVFRRIPVTAFG